MATKLDELVVELRAELDGFRKDLADGQRTMAEAMRGMQGEIANMTDKSGKSFLSFGKIAETALGVFSGAALLAGVQNAGATVSAFFEETLVEGIHAAIETEDAMNRVNIALAQAGEYSDDASEGMAKFADEVQRTTKFGDDAALSAAALIESLGQLDSDALPGATQAALDLSAALGIDLNTAAQMVGKAAAGEVGTFKRYGIAIQEGSTHAETFANTLDVLNSRFGGAAAAQVNTFSGATTQLGNQWQDLTKNFGNAIIQNRAVIDVIKEVNAVIGEFSASLGDNQQTMRELVAGGIVYVIEGLQGIVVAADAVGRLGEAAFELMTFSTKQLVAGIVAAQHALEGDFAGAWEALKAPAIETAAAIEESFSGESALGKVSETLARIQGAAERGFESVRSGAEAGVEPVNALAKSVEDYSATQVRLAEQGEKLAEKFNDPLGAEMQKAQLEKLKEMRSEDLISVEEYYAAVNEITAAQHAAEQEALDAALEQKLISQEEYHAALNGLETTRAAEKAKTDAAMQKAELDQNQKRLGYTSQMFGGLAALSKSKNAELFAIGKAAAVAQATVDGIAHVQKTLATVPYPFSIPLAAIAGATAAANVATISAQGLRTGIEEVPGIGFEDQFPAMLAPREGVLDAKTNPRLNRYLERQEQLERAGRGGGGGPTYVFNITAQGSIVTERQLGLLMVEQLQNTRFATGASPV